MAISNILFNILNGISDAVTARKKLSVPRTTNTDDGIVISATDEQINLDYIIDADNTLRMTATPTYGAYYTRKVNGTWTAVPLAVARGGTGGGSVNEALQNLNLAPKSGQAISGAFTAYGWITNNGTEACLTVPIGYYVSSTTAYSKSNVTTFSCSFRTVDGDYMGGAINSDLKSYITTIELRSLGRGFYIVLTKSGGWGITNNTPFAGNLNFGMTVP